MNTLVNKLKLIWSGYWNLFFKTKTSREEEKRRYKICLRCKHRIKFINTCMLCGCNCLAKCHADYKIDSNNITKGGCPLKKW